MNQPVNLNRARKQRARAEARARGTENAAKSGRTKAERLMEALRNERAAKMLDRHRIDDDE